MHGWKAKKYYLEVDFILDVGDIISNKVRGFLSGLPYGCVDLHKNVE